MPKKVGIPRALIYYKFAPMWTKFFTVLGAEVIISPKTNKMIRELSIDSAPDEDCYSTKLFFGHTLYLKDKVDYLFIPIYGSKEKYTRGCPKFLGIASVLRSMYPNLPEIISPHYSTTDKGHGKIAFFLKSFKVGLKFTKNPFRIIHAFKEGVKAYHQYYKKMIRSKSEIELWEKSEIRINEMPILQPDEKPVKVALVGHSYVINDEYCTLDLKKKLTQLGVDYITSDQVPKELYEPPIQRMEGNLYFEYERPILGAIMHFVDKKTIDGIIHLMIFACGPDSLVSEIAARYAKRQGNVSLLQIVLDDLTAEAGLKTRIEAFIDTLKRRKKRNAINIPPLRIAQVRI